MVLFRSFKELIMDVNCLIKFLVYIVLVIIVLNKFRLFFLNVLNKNIFI